MISIISCNNGNTWVYENNRTIFVAHQSVLKYNKANGHSLPKLIF